MNVKIGNVADLASGVAMIAAALFAVYLASGLDHGTLTSMGPGYFPRYVAGLLAIVGLALVVRGFRTDGALAFRLRIRPIIAVVGSIMFFSFALRSFGLAITAAGTILLASLAASPFRPVTVAITAAVLSTGVCLIFAYGLGMPIPILPRF